MSCWAIASPCCLRILADKQDNASVTINSKPRDMALLFVLYNSDASNLKLVFEGLWSDLGYIIWYYAIALKILILP